MILRKFFIVQGSKYIEKVAQKLSINQFHLKWRHIVTFFIASCSTSQNRFSVKLSLIMFSIATSVGEYYIDILKDLIFDLRDSSYKLAIKIF